MKNILFILFLLSIVFFSACNEKDCIQDNKCSEQPPTGVTCQAYFESWIYNPETKDCEYKGYSGCSPVGFDSEAECEKCDCKD